MKTTARMLLLTWIVCASCKISNAQTTHYRLEAGVNAGTLLYQGDLIESSLGSFKGAYPMANLWIAKPFNSYFSWRGNLTFGAMSADESRFANPSWKRSRNFKFSTPLTEITGMLVFNPYGDNGRQSYHALTPYAMIGAGASFINVSRDWSRVDEASGVKSALQDGITKDSLHTPPHVLAALPVGLGVKWMVTSRLALNAEATMRFVFNDYLDGFSYAANPGRKDSYYGLSLGVSFLFGGTGVECPRVPKE